MPIEQVYLPNRTTFQPRQQPKAERTVKVQYIADTFQSDGKLVELGPDGILALKHWEDPNVSVKTQQEINDAFAEQTGFRSEKIATRFIPNPSTGGIRSTDARGRAEGTEGSFGPFVVALGESGLRFKFQSSVVPDEDGNYVVKDRYLPLAADQYQPEATTKSLQFDEVVKRVQESDKEMRKNINDYVAKLTTHKFASVYANDQGDIVVQTRDQNEAAHHYHSTDNGKSFKEIVNPRGLQALFGLGVKLQFKQRISGYQGASTQMLPYLNDSRARYLDFIGV